MEKERKRIVVLARGELRGRKRRELHRSPPGGEEGGRSSTINNLEEKKEDNKK